MDNVSCKASRFTVEELDDVSEVHVVLQDDVPVDLHQRQSNEEHEVTGRDALGGPDSFPHCKHVIVHKLWNTTITQRNGTRGTRCEEAGGGSSQLGADAETPREPAIQFKYLKNIYTAIISQATPMKGFHQYHCGPNPSQS